MIKNSLHRFIFILSIVIQLVTLNEVNNNCFASSANLPSSAYKVMPWSIGQYVVYKIISMEGEDSDNRYKICITGKEILHGKTYFWLRVDIFESVVYYGYDKITKYLKNNISFKALMLPKDTPSFINNPSDFIFSGIFPKEPIKFAVRIGEGAWHFVDAENFLSHNYIIEDTPYSLTPYYKGKINFTKLKIDEKPNIIDTPAGKFLCSHFFVNTDKKEEYWDEGFDLWRTEEVPITGLLKMDFSKTLYWEKWSYRSNGSIARTIFDYIKALYGRRVSGRREPDTCTILLLDYGPRK